ncbi:MAG: LemA family protein [Muribaculaceae bacterium]|nr:LemA family protein [Muribaculaceae bacterium]
MKKLFIAIIVIAVVVLGLFSWGKGVYNGFVQQQESVEAAWSQVENDYQRRADLVPNLVATVKGYAEHERETLEAVLAARASATQIKVDADDLTPEKLQQFQQVQGELGAALGRLIAVQENYPDLKANQNFLQLQEQLESTENRITVSRRDFNAAAQTYNTAIRTFPQNIFAGLFGFERKPYFEAAAGAQTAPKVEF